MPLRDRIQRQNTARPMRFTSSRSILTSAALLAVASAALWLLSGAVLCESVLRVRVKAQQAPTHVPLQTHWRSVHVTARDGALLKGWLLSPANPSGHYVVLLHGIKDSKSGMMRLARLFLESHYTVLATDNRGQGESGGELVTYGILERDDFRRWMDWLISNERPRNVFAVGESLGAAVLLDALPYEHRLSAAVAECPYANFERVGIYRVAQRLPFPPRIGRFMSTTIVSSGFVYARMRYGLAFEAASPENVVGRIETPVLLIHGLDDTKTPASESRILAAHNTSKTSLWLVPGAGHVNAYAAVPEEFKDRVLKWFAENGKDIPPAGVNIR